MVQFDHYRYNPSLPAAIVAAALYGIVFVATLVRFIKYKSWVWVIMVVASAMEVGGYIARCISVKNPDSSSVFITQTALIVLAPVLMAAACYIVFVTDSFNLPYG